MVVRRERQRLDAASMAGESVQELSAVGVNTAIVLLAAGGEDLFAVGGECDQLDDIGFGGELTTS